MKNVFLLAYLPFVFFFNSNNFFSKTANVTVSKNVTVYQGEKEIEITGEGIIKLKKDHFSIRFCNKKYNAEKEEFYSTKIAAFKKKSDLGEIVLGKQIESISCFFPGTGMAPSADGFYDALTFTKIAHEYLYYANETEKRVNLLSQEKGMLRLEFPVNKLNIDGKESVISESAIQKFFIVVVTDKNLNGVIDNGELSVMNIVFE